MDADSDAAEKTCETERLVDEKIGDGGNGSEAGNPEASALLPEAGSQSQSTSISSSKADEISSRSCKESNKPHPYHLKHKYTFRSDSVFSDVIPMTATASSQSPSTSAHEESREKSGSLSSLKAKESKWATLKKKLGKLNSHSHSLSQTTPGSEKTGDENKERSAAKSLSEKRSLFQRAKTMSILPIHKSSKEKEESAPKRVAEPPELFNVGGEMNLIPLELLIDVNDIAVRK